MCGLCGCAEATAGSSEPHGQASGSHGADDEHEHLMPDGQRVRHRHTGGGAPHPVHGVLTGHEHSVGLDEREVRRISVERDVMATNDRDAALNRARFAAEGVFVVNLMSSPGSGKTTLLVRTLEALEGQPLAVIEGDQQTTLDAERIRATGVPAVQINTGKGCHLDADMVFRALHRQPAPAQGTLFIENVGNLVCPAGFDLGESKKVVVASITEGEDKPLKYPDMYAVADVVLVNKMDLAQVLGVDVRALVANVRRVNARALIFELSARTGAGFEPWVTWLQAQRRGVTGEPQPVVDALRA